MNRNRIGWLLALGFAWSSSEFVHSEPQYFPLEVGNRWIYEIAQHLFSGTREVAVEAMRGGSFFIRTRTEGPGRIGDVVHVRANGNEIDIELSREGFVPFYRFDEDAWLHRDCDTCDDNSAIRVVARDEVVTTPAGVFTDCLKLVFLGRCIDAGLLAQWWAPDVGLVKSEQDNITGAVT